MIIVKIGDGMGNQLFNYACGYAAARRENDTLKLDTSEADNSTLRDFELDKFHLKYDARESFPNRTLPNRNIYVLTFDAGYEVSDPEHHFVVTNVNDFKDFDGDLYISGGASVYKLFMTGSAKLMPDIVVDCMYRGEVNSALEGAKIDISPCVEVLHKSYRQISVDYELDNILTTVWVRKGEFVEQSVLKRIIEAIEKEDEQ